MKNIYKKNCFVFFLSLVSTALLSNNYDVGADKKIIPIRAEASEARINHEIENSFDGYQATLYYSRFEGTEFPVVLTYYFADVEQIDYLIYYPFTGSSKKGSFKEFELWIAAGIENEFIKEGDYDFQGAWNPSKISFSEGIKSPKAIRFVVKSAELDVVGCAEMAFYKKNSQHSIPDVFTDKTCSELRPGVNRKMVRAIESKFYRQLAISLYKNRYDKNARVREWKQLPSGWSSGSGITAKEGDEIIVFVGNTYNGNVYICIPTTLNDADESYYPLNEGMNSIIADRNGMICVGYYNEDKTAKRVTVHIATGKKDKYTINRINNRLKNEEEIVWSQTLTPKQMKEDIDFFFKFIAKAHVNMYAFVSKDSMNIRKKELYKKCSNPMTVKEFHLQMSQLSGMFDEHTGMPFYLNQYISADLIFPSEIKVIGKELFIENNGSYNKVLSINDLDIDDIFTVITNIYHKKSKSPQSLDLELTTIFPILLYHTTNCRSPFKLQIENDNGEKIEYITQGTQGEGFNERQTLIAKNLRDFRSYPNDSIAIIDYNSSIDDGVLSKWLDDVFKTISDDSIQHLFIDISRNSGGGALANNLIFNKIEHKNIRYTSNIKVIMSSYFIEDNVEFGLSPFLTKFIVRVLYGKKHKAKNYYTYPPTSGYSGNIYLIQGSQTYSAAVDMVAWFKYSRIGTIIGEETGGPGASYSSFVTQRLPNSKLFVRSATNFVQYPGGKIDRGFLPEVPVQLDYSKKYYELEDLKQFLEIINTQNSKN